jgi:hypothetical protein
MSQAPAAPRRTARLEVGCGKGLRDEGSLNGEHEPDLPFVIVDRQGCHVDLPGIGELWDGPIVARVLRDRGGTSLGPVPLKDGTARNF